MSFKSKFIKLADNKKFNLTDLTIHGITKPITLEMIVMGTREHPRTKKPMAASKVTGKLKRIDCGVGANYPTATVSDKIEIKGIGEFTKE